MSPRATAAALLSRRNPCHIRTSTATLQYSTISWATRAAPWLILISSNWQKIDNYCIKQREVTTAIRLVTLSNTYVCPNTGNKPYGSPCEFFSLLRSAKWVVGHNRVYAAISLFWGRMLVFPTSSTSGRLIYSAQTVPAGRNAITSDVNVVCRPTTADCCGMTLTGEDVRG